MSYLNKLTHIIIVFFLLSIVINVFPVIAGWVCRGAIYIERDGSIKPSDAPIKYVNGRYVVIDDILGATIYIYHDNTILDINGHFLKIKGSPIIYIEKARRVIITNGIITGKGLGAISIVDSVDVSITNIVFKNDSNIQFLVDNSRKILFENLSAVGEFGPYGNYVFKIKSSEDIVLRNIYLPLNSKVNYGVAFYDSSNILVQNVTIGPGTYDLVFSRSKNAVVNGFNAGNSHVGLELYKSENITTQYISGGMLYIIDSKDSKITSSEFSFLKMKKGTRITIENTVFSNEWSWIESAMGLTLKNIVFNYKVSISSSMDISMYNVTTSIITIENSQMIRIDHIYFSLWKENNEIDYMSLDIINSSDVIISNATYGVLEAEPNAMTQSSLLIKNSCGITICCSNLSLFRAFYITNSSGNTFTLNIMPGTPEIEPPNMKNNWNTTLGNYWPSYQGVDKNGDGIGDTPYKINDVNIDYRPLMTKNITYYMKYMKQTTSKPLIETTTKPPIQETTTLATQETTTPKQEQVTTRKNPSTTIQTSIANIIQNKTVIIAVAIAIISILVIAILAKKK